MATTNTEGIWEQVWLPLWPLASDNLRDGIYRMSRESALGLRYIEANPSAISNLLVVDIDHDDALLRALWNRKDRLPNAVVENAANGHAHAIWAMKSPIPRTEYASRKAIAYAAAVTEGLRRSVDGDAAYSGLLTKNPEHPSWNASWHTDHLYELDELRDHLTESGFMPSRSWVRERRKHPVGLGRNCDIFESARVWANEPQLMRQYLPTRDSTGLYQAISGHVHELNADYADPLPWAEARDIANSIHRWITTRSHMWRDGIVVYEANLTLVQHHRGVKSGAARQLKEKTLLDLLTKEALS